MVDLNLHEFFPSSINQRGSQVDEKKEKQEKKVACFFLTFFTTFFYSVATTVNHTHILTHDDRVINEEGCFRSVVFYITIRLQIHSNNSDNQFQNTQWHQQQL